MTQKNKVQLKICGATYTIVTEDEPEYVESLGELLDSEMKSITGANPSLSFSVQFLLLLIRQITVKRQLRQQIIFVRRLKITLKMLQDLRLKLMLKEER